MSKEHFSVMLNEALEGLNIKPDGNYIDATLGRAGHSKEILKKLTTGHLYGFDQDIEAINKSSLILSEISDKYTLFHLNFTNIYDEMKKLGLENKIDGILFDLGVSSPQFDNPSRGFSYKYDAQLDMRMDNRNPLDAKIIVNTYSYEDLKQIFKEYGDEKYASQIAKNICKKRSEKMIETTFELVDIIKASKPFKELKKEGHPAKQVFQALRIAVNDEINVLKKTLTDASKLLASKGRIVVISFHSGEDRIVKSHFKSLAIMEGNRISGPMEQIETKFNLITHKPITASEEELAINNRSHSAKLRILEKK